jgi:hypothetical protein
MYRLNKVIEKIKCSINTLFDTNMREKYIMKRKDKRLINYVNDNNHQEWMNPNPANNNFIKPKKFKKLLNQYRGDIHQLIKKTKLCNIPNMNLNDFFIDSEIMLILTFKDELKKFRNILPLKQCVEILELLASKLEPINQKIYVSKMICEFDFVDYETLLEIDKLKKEVDENANYSNEEYYARLSMFDEYVDVSNNILENQYDHTPEHYLPAVARACKEIKEKSNPSYTFDSDDYKKLTDEKEYVVVYRGFTAVEDTPIRFEDNKLVQTHGNGVSYSFDKHVALAFAMRSAKIIKRNRDKKCRAVVGKYRIHKDDIFAYVNEKSEREIILKSRNTFAPLYHYEFFTDDALNCNKRMKSSVVPFRTHNISVDEYADSFADTKIASVFNEAA